MPFKSKTIKKKHLNKIIITIIVLQKLDKFNI